MILQAKCLFEYGGFFLIRFFVFIYKGSLWRCDDTKNKIPKGYSEYICYCALFKAVDIPYFTFKVEIYFKFVNFKAFIQIVYSNIKYITQCLNDIINFFNISVNE